MARNRGELRHTNLGRTDGSRPGVQHPVHLLDSSSLACQRSWVRWVRLPAGPVVGLQRVFENPGSAPEALWFRHHWYLETSGGYIHLLVAFHPDPYRPGAPRPCSVAAHRRTCLPTTSGHLAGTAGTAGPLGRLVEPVVVHTFAARTSIALAHCTPECHVALQNSLLQDRSPPNLDWTLGPSQLHPLDWHRQTLHHSELAVVAFASVGAAAFAAS